VFILLLKKFTLAFVCVKQWQKDYHYCGVVRFSFFSRSNHSMYFCSHFLTAVYYNDDSCWYDCLSARTALRCRRAYPANTPKRFPLGSRMSYFTGPVRYSRRFLSAGCRRVPDGITHPGPAWYPYESRLMKISRDPYGYHAEPGARVIPSGTRLHPADKNRRVPAGNTVRDPWGRPMAYGTQAKRTVIFSKPHFLSHFLSPVFALLSPSCFLYRLNELWVWGSAVARGYKMHVG